MARIKNLLILFLCLIRFVFKGKANKKVLEPKKILIVQVAKLGDMICTTPMFRAVKARFPKAKIFVCGLSYNQAVLAGNSDIDKYIVFNKKFFSFLNLIKKEKFDFACFTAPSPFVLAVLYLAGIPLISAPKIKNGIAPCQTIMYKFLLPLAEVWPHQMGSYAPREYLRLLESMEIYTNDTKKHIYFNKESKKKIEVFLQLKGVSPEDFLVGISVSAGNKSKVWGIERFVEVANHILKNFKAKIIISGADSEKEEADKMALAIGNESSVINTAGLFGIEELKALVSKMSVLISVDSGPIYIAEALGVPTLDIIGPIDEKEQPPISEMNRIVVAKREKPQMHVMNARVFDVKEASRQVDDITVKMVTDEFDELYKLLLKKE